MGAIDSDQSEADITKQIISHIDALPDERKEKLLSLLQTWVANSPREFVRASCLEPVYYCTSDRLYKDLLHNISIGGLFIGTPELFSVDQKISLALAIPDNQPPLKITGNIVRIASAGIGVKFNAKDQNQIEMLKSKINGIQAH